MLENFCNSHPHALARMARINYKKPTLVCGDIPDCAAFRTVLRLSGVSLVLNFVVLK
jgi:UDP-glucose 4-epimerase